MQIGTSATTITLLYLSGSDLQVDWLEFTSVSPVELTTWRAVKQLYR